MSNNNNIPPNRRTFVLHLLDNGLIELQTMLLHNGNNHSGYGYHKIELSIDELSMFFKLYKIKHLKALEDYFLWRALPIKPKGDVTSNQNIIPNQSDDINIDEFA